jgi:hypothetical protein
MGCITQVVEHLPSKGEKMGRNIDTCAENTPNFTTKLSVGEKRYIDPSINGLYPQSWGCKGRCCFDHTFS